MNCTLDRFTTAFGYPLSPTLFCTFRPSATLSVRGEQVPENSVYRALMNTIAQMKSRISNLVDYATCENILLNSANVDLG